MSAYFDALVQKWRNLFDQLLPRGDAIPRDPASNWGKWITAISTAFAGVDAWIDQVIAEWMPTVTLSRFNDWETTTEGSDDCAIVVDTIDERRARILAKLRMTAGGMDGKNGSSAAIAYLESVAAALGYNVTITKAATCVLNVTIHAYSGGVACFPRRYGDHYNTNRGLYGDCGYALLSCIFDRVAPARYQLNYIWNDEINRFTVINELDLDAITNCGLDKSVGITINGFRTTDFLIIEYLDGVYKAVDFWSGNPGEFRGTVFQVTDNTNNINHNVGDYGGFTTVEDALAAAQAAGEITITGGRSYTLWIKDFDPGNNAGGLSLKISRQYP